MHADRCRCCATPRSSVSLQRGRVQMYADRAGRVDVYVIVVSRASTGPRADARGSALSLDAVHGRIRASTGPRADARGSYLSPHTFRKGPHASTEPRADARGSLIRSPSSNASTALQRGRVQMHADRRRYSSTRSARRASCFNGAACRCTRIVPRSRRKKCRRSCFNGAACRCTRIESKSKASRSSSAGFNGAACRCTRIAYSLSAVRIASTSFNGAACRCTRIAHNPFPVSVGSVASTGPRADARGSVAAALDQQLAGRLQRGRVQMHADRGHRR